MFTGNPIIRFLLDLLPSSSSSSCSERQRERGGRQRERGRSSAAVEMYQRVQKPIWQASPFSLISLVAGRLTPGHCSSPLGAPQASTTSLVLARTVNFVDSP